MLPAMLGSSRPLRHLITPLHCRRRIARGARKLAPGGLRGPARVLLVSVWTRTPPWVLSHPESALNIGSSRRKEAVQSKGRPDERWFIGDPGRHRPVRRPDRAGPG